MLSRMLNLLAVKTTPFEILCIGVVIISLMFLTDTIKNPAYAYIPFEPIAQPSREERLYAMPQEYRINWCKVRRDCKVLAEAVVYEARSEDEKGQAAVAHVILNRIEDERWGDTVEDVVYERKQFSYTNLGQKQKNVPSKEDWNNAMEICFFILNGVIESPVGDAKFYHTKKVRPKWAKKLDYVATIGHHVFYE